jgi:hypothetical protein
MRTGAGALLVFVLFAPCAVAGENPLALYLAGDFARAEAAGVAQNDAQGLAIAARSVLADDMMREQPCLDCLLHAEDLSRRAIASDPKQPEGHIYLAAAIGYRARIIGNLAAQTEGLAAKAKRELDTALADDPSNPWALAAIGSWHIEIVRTAGPTLARWLFGARFATGQGYYAKALALAPANLVLHYQYSLVLASYDLASYRKEVESELGLAVACEPGSAYEVFARKRAQELLNSLKRGDAAEIERLVHRDEGYPA